MYPSTTGRIRDKNGDVVGFKFADPKAIAKKELDVLLKYKEEGNLKPGQKYQLALIGYSAGAHEAVQVANAIATLLNSGKEEDSKYKALANDIEIHLATFDAIAPKTKRGLPQPSPADLLTGDARKFVASWHNYFQTRDTGADLRQVLPDVPKLKPLQGQPEFDFATNRDISVIFNNNSIKKYGGKLNAAHAMMMLELVEEKNRKIQDSIVDGLLP